MHNRKYQGFLLKFKLLFTILGFSCFYFANSSIAQGGEQEFNLQSEIIKFSNLDSLQIALQNARASGDNQKIESCLQKIIDLSIEQKLKSNIYSYQLQLQDHYRKYPNPENLSRLLVSLGDFYLEEKLARRAIEYYNKSIDLETGDLSPSMLTRLSDSYLVLEKPDSAIILRDQLLKYHLNTNQEKEALATRRKIVTILIKAQRYQEALDHNLKIKDLIESKGNKTLLARAYNNIGYNYNLIKDYKSALSNFKVVENMNKKNNYLDKGDLYSNIGIVYGNLGDLNNAISYLSKAENNINKKENPSSLANLYHITSTIYYINGDIHNALIYSLKCNELAYKINDPETLKKNYRTTALVYEDLYEFDKALEYYQKHLNIRDSLLLEERLRKQATIQQQNQIEKSEKEIKLILADQEVQNLLISQLELEKEKLNLASDKLKLESERKAADLALLLKEQEVKDATYKNQALIAQRTKQELALAEQKLINQQADQRLIALRQKEKLAQAELKVNQALQKDKEKEIALLTKDKELLTNREKINQLQLEQEASFRNTAYGIGGLLGLMILMFLTGLLNSRRKNKILGKQKAEIEKQKDQIESSKNLIEKEKSKSDALLLNILPKDTAAELKKYGSSKPRHFDKVSVLFTDFSNFTTLSEGLNAEELLQELNKHFLAFDDICEKYSIEKIKTIGDSYMCASGLSSGNTNHAKNLVLAAIEMQNFVKQNNEKRKLQNLKPWKMRAGIHTGPIIAGVVGSKKFTFDIWGDTVNTASRMESSGDLGQINISATTYQLVKDEFTCTYRGKVMAKNKGEMEMYFVEY